MVDIRYGQREDERQLPKRSLTSPIAWSSEYCKVSQLVYRFKTKWVIHRSRVGRKRRFKVDYEARNWRRRWPPWTQSLGVYPLNCFCTPTHAWEKNHAQRFETRKYLHWQQRQPQSWWPWTIKTTLIINLWSFLKSWYSSLHVSRSTSRKRLWLEIRCLVTWVHCLWALHVEIAI